MARLEFINYQRFNGRLNAEGGLAWSPSITKPIRLVPQLYWHDSAPWAEANLWALERTTNTPLDDETVKRTMKHLRRYAEFLETKAIDWRHFPILKADQPLRQFRKQLLDDADTGKIAISTARNCMSAVIQFYRFADANDLVGGTSPLWADRLAVIPFMDSRGFKRTITRLVSDLSIPDRARVGAVLEDGLLPLRAEHMTELLRYTASNAVEELHLMLATGFFTGARIGTITTLTVTSLETAREDSQTPGIYLLPVGPGTGISTKFSVSGEIMVPKAVLEELRRYATCTTRLLRESKAHKKHKNLLFLTRSGKPYSVATVNRLNYEMRRRARNAGMQFMNRFRFHQSRATFGTWLMQLLLESGGKTAAIRVVRDAMLHKDERTTLLYITFLENTPAKAHFAAEFNNAFTGLNARDWNKMPA